MIIEIKMHNTDSYKFNTANLTAPGVTDVASFITAYDLGTVQTVTISATVDGTTTTTVTSSQLATIVSTKNTTVINKSQISSIVEYV